MDDKDNALLQSGTSLPARSSPLAVASASVAFATLVAMVACTVLRRVGFERTARYVAFLQLTFPVAIVCGHLALRRIRKNPAREKGNGLALLGLMVGYFNLLVVAMIVYFIFSRSN